MARSFDCLRLPIWKNRWPEPLHTHTHILRLNQHLQQQMKAHGMKVNPNSNSGKAVTNGGIIREVARN